MKFADKLHDSITQRGSFLCAGLDPVLETIPTHFVKQAASQANHSGDIAYFAITNFYAMVLNSIDGMVAAVKPNLAFFEQYGPAGISAFVSVCHMCRERALPIIADAKRGDIGSTAKAYSAAFLGRSLIGGRKEAIFDVDALTVNPFLGFDTLAPFVEDCKEFEKGIFVLVRTSNPGASDLQDPKDEKGKSVSEKIAGWIHQNSQDLIGKCEYSGLGAVVGATNPADAAELRKLMPKAFFLIPGFGAQGGSAKDAVAGFSQGKHGAVVNVSRALLNSFSSLDLDLETLKQELQARAGHLNRDLAEALASST